jgi:hypothetical protein
LTPAPAATGKSRIYKFAGAGNIKFAYPYSIADCKFHNLRLQMKWRDRTPQAA